MTIASKSVRRSYYYYYPYYYYYYYKEKERKVNFRTRFFLMLANESLAFEHSPLFFVDIIIHCSLLRTCRVRVEEKEEFLVYTVLWTLTCHPYLESATALSDKIIDLGISSFIAHTKYSTFSWDFKINRSWLLGIARIMDLLCVIAQRRYCAILNVLLTFFNLFSIVTLLLA